MSFQPLGSLFPRLFAFQGVPIAPHTTTEIEQAVYDELERIQREPPTTEELQRVRNQIDASGIQRLQSSFGLAFQLSSSEALWGNWSQTCRDQAALAAVSGEDVQRVARTYFAVHQPDRRHPGPAHRRRARVHPVAGPPAGRDQLMRRTVIFAALAAVVAAPALAAQDVRTEVQSLRFPALRFNPPTPTRITLSNGVPVYLLPDRALPTLAVQIVSRRGVANVPDSLWGVAWQADGLLRTGGTARLTPDSVDKLLEFYAINLFLSTDHEQSTASVAGLSRYRDQMLDLAFEVLRTPRNDTSRIRITVAQQEEGWRRRNDQFHLFEAFVMHLGGVDVAAYDLGAEHLGQVDSDIYRSRLEWSELSTGI